MSELQEKREYYKDRSLKAVYSVDEQGRKQGERKVYQKNNSEPELTETYIDDKIMKKVYANGDYETFDENGNLLHRKRTKKSENLLSDKGKQVSLDMSYKDGNEWTGTKEIQKLRDGRIVSSEKFELLEGVKHGKYIYKNYAKDKSEIAYFDKGVLHGEYQCSIFPPKCFNLEYLKVAEYASEQGYDRYSNGGFIDGYFTKGVFSGEILAKATNEMGTLSDVLTYKYSDNQLTEVQYERTTIRKFDQGKETYKLTNKEEISKPLNGQCFRKKRWREEDGWNWKWNSKLLEEWEQKDGKKHGLCKKYNEKGWLESETPYVDGKKHGFEKLYNSDGTVAKIKYWQNGTDCTNKYNRLKNIASKRIEKEKQIEAATGVKTRLPKMSKFEKTAAVVREKLGLSK